MSLVKNILLVFITALACFGIYSIYHKITTIKDVEEVNSTILLERVEKVFKLVTVEGNFNEIYSYENHIFADIWPFRKKALVQVNAKVSVGYDFESVKFIIDEDNKTLTLDGDLYADILSIDHDVKSYDFESGLFNPISNRDIAKMGAEAKEFIREKAEGSDLYDQAEAQKAELLEMLDWILKAAGWELVTEESVLLN
jgi:hypothetical protein